MPPRLALWIVVAAAALLLLVRAGDVPLVDPDESRFARTSVEMQESGDLVVPHFEGSPRLAKPPLVHWIQTFFFSTLGVNEWTARLHAALATLGSILLVGWIARRRFGEEAAAWAAAILATMPLVVVLGRVGTLDALLAVHVLAAVALDLAGPPAGGAYRAASLGAVTGLAFLVKGPVGVVVPLFVILAGRTAAGRELLPSAGAVLQAVAGWCVVVLPWGLAFVRRVGSSAVIEALRGEVLSRFSIDAPHSQPAWYYAQVVLVGFLPWTAPLVLGAGRAWRLRRTGEARTAIYAAAGLVVGLALFSLSRGKLPHYILPLAPLGAILVTWELGRELAAPRERTLGPTLLAATVGASAILLGLAGSLKLSGAARQVALTGVGIYAAAAALALVGAFRHRPRWVYGSAAAATWLFSLLAVMLLFPAIGRSRSAAALVESLPQFGMGRPVVTVGIRVPSLAFYLNRPTEFVEPDGLAARLDRGDDPLYVLAASDLSAMSPTDLERLKELGQSGKLCVYQRVDRLTGPGGGQ